jgi:hypothetical protein
MLAPYSSRSPNLPFCCDSLAVCNRFKYITFKIEGSVVVPAEKIASAVRPHTRARLFGLYSMVLMA